MRRFLSICSGIEAASVAFHPLGWQALAFAEIEPFPCSLLAHHYPQVPNLGDLTRWREWSPQLLAQADVLCGGTPCQAFSVAGLRGSLSDERGNLTLTFCHLFDEIDRIRHLHGRPPAVCLWENVPGVLNTPDNAFGHFLAGLAGEDVPLTPPGSRWTDAGYVRGPKRAVAWRTLDAQYFGLAQRRERVFVVASADPAFDPAAVLFELDGLRRDTPPRRGAGEGAAPTLSACTKGGGGLGTDAECDGAVVPERMTNAECRMTNEGVPEVANCLTRRMHKGLNTTLDEGQTPIVEVTPVLRGEPFSFKASHFTRGKDGAPAATAPPLSADADKGDQDTLVAAPIAFSSKDHGADASQDLSPTLRAGNHAGSHANGGNPPAIAFPERLSGTQCANAEDVSPVLQAQNPTAVALSESPSLPVSSSPSLASQWRVRRLTPEECEILQGFPVGYTLIPHVAPMQSRTKAKPRKGRRKGNDLSDTIDYLISLGVPRAEAEVLAHSPDGPRYKALGNSWAVPVARWIARRIDAMLSNPHSLRPV